MENIDLTVLRNRKTGTKEFRRSADKVARELATKAKRELSKRKGVRAIVLVPVLRSGLALLPAFLSVFPEASVGFIGLKRDEKTFKPKNYYQHLPPFSKKDTVLVLDPMLATGGSACATITALTESGAHENNIMFVGVISAPEGITAIEHQFPKATLFVATRDKKLDKRKYIVPGLGDFGDRYFGT